MTIRTTVISEIQRVAADQNKKLAPLTDDLPLLDSGLDSLCFAILVARLETRPAPIPSPRRPTPDCPIRSGI